MYEPKRSFENPQIDENFTFHAKFMQHYTNQNSGFFTKKGCWPEKSSKPCVIVPSQITKATLGGVVKVKLL